MVSSEEIFYIDDQLRFVFFGLECALHVEFNPSETERVFIDGEGDVDGVDCSAKQYIFYSSPSLRVTGHVDEYEPETVRLIVESKKASEPSLSAIKERAKYQVFRMKRWQEAQETSLEELHQRITEREDEESRMNSMNKFADNPFYVQYEALLKELHHLIAAGKGNEDKANAVRDEMDAPEQKLNQKEIMRLNGLSADLYMLQDAEVYEPYVGTPEELITALSEALGRLDYEAILALLRKGTPFLRTAQVAALRGRCYAMLGHLDTALLFMRYAVEKEPEQVAHRLYILGLLIQLNRAQEALPEVESYARSIAEPFLLAA